MLPSFTYKVVNDANDALNVFVEMVSIKLALQSLIENRKKIVYMILITRIIVVIISINFLKNLQNLRICSCLACVYRVMDARGKFGEHERCVRVVRGDSRV